MWGWYLRVEAGGETSVSREPAFSPSHNLQNYDDARWNWDKRFEAYFTAFDTARRSVMLVQPGHLLKFSHASTQSALFVDIIIREAFLLRI